MQMKLCSSLLVGSEMNENVLISFAGGKAPPSHHDLPVNILVAGNELYCLPDQPGWGCSRTWNRLLEAELFDVDDDGKPGLHSLASDVYALRLHRLRDQTLFFDLLDYMIETRTDAHGAVLYRKEEPGRPLNVDIPLDW